jgi:hypothetical protein
MKAKTRIDYWLPYELAKDIEEFFKNKPMTKALNELVQLGLTIMKNKDSLNNPEFVNTLVENLEADKIDDFFTKLEPVRLEALYAFAKAEMEKRYGKERLDKFV